MSSKAKAKALADDYDDEELAMLELESPSEGDPGQWMRNSNGDLDWEYTDHTVRTWSPNALLSHLWRKSFSIPPREYNPSAPFVWVELDGGEVVTLPHGYRLPLMFVAKYRWEITLTKITNERLWKAEKSNILHLSRLCENLFRRAQAKAARGGMEKGWRCVMFDRLLARFYKHWARNGPKADKGFLSTHSPKEYDRDVLKHDWKRWCLRGLNGVRMTEEEVTNGITIAEFRKTLTQSENGGWSIDGHTLLHITDVVLSEDSSLSELSDDEMDGDGESSDQDAEGEDEEIVATLQDTKRQRDILTVDEDEVERAMKRTKIENAIPSNSAIISTTVNDFSYYKHYEKYPLTRTLAAMERNPFWAKPISPPQGDPQPLPSAPPPELQTNASSLTSPLQTFNSTPPESISVPQIPLSGPPIAPMVSPPMATSIFPFTENAGSHNSVPVLDIPRLQTLVSKLRDLHTPVFPPVASGSSGSPAPPPGSNANTPEETNSVILVRPRASASRASTSVLSSPASTPDAVPAPKSRPKPRPKSIRPPLNRPAAATIQSQKNTRIPPPWVAKAKAKGLPITPATQKIIEEEMRAEWESKKAALAEKKVAGDPGTSVNPPPEEVEESDDAAESTSVQIPVVDVDMGPPTAVQPDASLPDVQPSPPLDEDSGKQLEAEAAGPSIVTEIPDNNSKRTRPPRNSSLTAKKTATTSALRRGRSGTLPQQPSVGPGADESVSASISAQDKGKGRVAKITARKRLPPTPQKKSEQGTERRKRTPRPINPMLALRPLPSSSETGSSSSSEESDSSESDDGESRSKARSKVSSKAERKTGKAGKTKDGDLEIPQHVLNAKALELLVNLVDVKQVLASKLPGSNLSSSSTEPTVTAGPSRSSRRDRDRTPPGQFRPIWQQLEDDRVLAERFENIEGKLTAITDQVAGIVGRLQALEGGVGTQKQSAGDTIMAEAGKGVEEGGARKESRPQRKTVQGGVPHMEGQQEEETPSNAAPRPQTAQKAHEGPDADVEMGDAVVGPALGVPVRKMSSEISVQTEGEVSSHPPEAQSSSSAPEEPCKQPTTRTSSVSINSPLVELQVIDHHSVSETDGSESTLNVVSKDDHVDSRTQVMTSSLSLLVDNLVSVKMLSVMQGMAKGKGKDTSDPHNTTSSTTPSGPESFAVTSLLDELRSMKDEFRARELRDKEEMQAMRELHSAEVDALRRRLSYLENTHNPAVSASGGRYRSSSSSLGESSHNHVSAPGGSTDHLENGRHAYPRYHGHYVNGRTPFSPSTEHDVGGASGVKESYPMPTPTPSERSYPFGRHGSERDDDMPLPIKTQRKQHIMSFPRAKIG